MEMEERKSNKALWITAGVVAILIVAFITNGFGILTGSVISEQNSNLQIENSPVLGEENAKIAIYIFSDFSCPACAYADEKITPKLIEDYVETGKAKLVFKYTPGHGQGAISHEIALALNQQNLFWEFAELAYKNSAQTNNQTAMLDLARSLGADMSKVQAYLDSNEAMSQLSSDIDMAKSNGVYATPTFIIGNQMIKGAQDYSVFQKVINSQL